MKSAHPVTTNSDAHICDIPEAIPYPTYPDTLAPPTYPPRYAVASSQNGAPLPARRKSSAVFAILLNHIPEPINANTRMTRTINDIVTVMFITYLLSINNLYLSMTSLFRPTGGCCPSGSRHSYFLSPMRSFHSA